MAITIDGSNGISDVRSTTDGSASTPAVRGTDTNTGIFFPAADTIAFAEGGAEVARFDSSGRLLVNRTATGGSVFDTCKIQVTGNISVSGSDSELILQNTGSDARVWRILSASGGGSTAALRFYDDTASAERMRITSGGDLSLGGTPAAPPTVANDIFAGGLYLNPNRRTTGSGANTFFDSSSGAIFRSTSSIKYKIDVNDATYGLLDVLKLRPVTYKGKSDTDGNKVFGGFIAEEIDALGLKEFVEYDSEGNPDSLAYGNMVSLLTKAIQEQQAIITDLKSRIEALEQA
jgi:hypothetical protein